MERKEQHAGKCCFWDDEDHCDCGERYGNKLEDEIVQLRADLAAAQSLRAEAEGEVERLKVENAAYYSHSWTNERHEVDVAEARADAFREGVVAAAGIARVMPRVWDVDAPDPQTRIADAILAAASEPAKVDEAANMIALLVQEIKDLLRDASVTGQHIATLLQPAPEETELERAERIIRMVDEQHEAAEGSTLAFGEPAKVPVVFGCHCELEEGATPDGCVIDEGKIDDCCHAQDGVERAGNFNVDVGTYSGYQLDAQKALKKIS